MLDLGYDDAEMRGLIASFARAGSAEKADIMFVFRKMLIEPSPNVSPETKAETRRILSLPGNGG